LVVVFSLQRRCRRFALLRKDCQLRATSATRVDRSVVTACSRISHVCFSIIAKRGLFEREKEFSMAQYFYSSEIHRNWRARERMRREKGMEKEREDARQGGNQLGKTVLNVWIEERRCEQTSSMYSYTLILFLFRFFFDSRPRASRSASELIGELFAWVIAEIISYAGKDYNSW